MAGYDKKECVLTCLPTLPRGRPFLVGVELDITIQDYIRALRQAGGVINTAIVHVMFCYTRQFFSYNSFPYSSVNIVPPYNTF